MSVPPSLWGVQRVTTAGTRSDSAPPQLSRTGVCGRHHCTMLVTGFGHADSACLRRDTLCPYAPYAVAAWSFTTLSAMPAESSTPHRCMASTCSGQRQLQVQHHQLQLVIEVVGDGAGHPTQALGLLHLLVLNLKFPEDLNLDQRPHFTRRFQFFWRPRKALPADHLDELGK